MANIYTLPFDVWLYILECLSLDDLVQISRAFDSTTSAAFQITKRHAMKIISGLLINGTAKAHVDISGYGACYKFGLKYPRAWNVPTSRRSPTKSPLRRRKLQSRLSSNHANA